MFYENRYDRFRFAEFLLWPGDYDFVAGFVVHVSGSSFRVLNLIQVWCHCLFASGPGRLVFAFGLQHLHSRVSGRHSPSSGRIPLLLIHGRRVKEVGRARG